MGRKPIGKTAMTATERQRRRRARLRKERPLEDLRAAWAVCDRKQRARFMRELRAPLTAAKKARRAQRERELAEKIRPHGRKPTVSAGLKACRSSTASRVDRISEREHH